MRIVFMGTPEFAVPSLTALNQSRHQVALVVTQPDRPKGRGQKLAFSPVKQKALDLGLPIIQPESLKTPGFHERLRSENADLLVVVAFRILPESLFPLARFGAVNVHASLLPKYRGAAPIQWAIAEGETETGVTVFQLDRQVDHGSILAQRKTPIGPEETTEELYGRLMALGSELLLEAVEALEGGKAAPREQEHGEACPAPKLRKEDGLIDWSRSAKSLHNRIRAFNPYPVCHTHEPSGRVLRVWKAHVVAEASTGPGTVTQSEDKYPVVGCGELRLKLLEVQPEGKPRMSGADYLRGVHDIAALRYG